MASIDHFKEDIGRAFAIQKHAEPLPHQSNDEKLLRDDLLRSAWMFGVGALDAYFCDLYTDLLASVLMSKEREKSVQLPPFLMSVEVTLDAVYADYANRHNWRWRMMARKRMERENVLSVAVIKNLLNPFMPKGNKLFADVIDNWIQDDGATRRVFGIPPATYLAEMTAAGNEADQDKRKRLLEGLRNNAAGGLKKRFSQLIQRRHDCIHNCDRPRSTPKRIHSAGSVKLVLNDIEFLVLHVDAHVRTQFRQFLLGLGFSTIAVNQVGY